MNNKGFAITTILYGTLILFLMLLVSMLGILSTYKDRLSILIDNTNGARCIINGNCTNSMEKDAIAYAVYSADDNSLSFYKTSDTITQNSTYNGKKVTEVYTGFENVKYSRVDDIPWYSKREVVQQVIIYNEIKPISTKAWFIEMTGCKKFDLKKLNTSNVTDMNTMFGRAASDNTLELIGLESWDTSNVTDMGSMFDETGYYADYSLDLSNWNVDLVLNHDYFNNYVEDKIIAPIWKN